MYEELVKSLRQCADAACNGCKNELYQIGCRGKLQREAADAIESLSGELKTCRNELCLYCGQYMERHKGACNGCRWLPKEET